MPWSLLFQGSSSAILYLNNLEEGTYIFRLTVTDSKGRKDSDEATVIVKPGKHAVASGDYNLYFLFNGILQACDFSGFFYKSLFPSHFSWKKRSSLYCVQTFSFLFVGMWRVCKSSKTKGRPRPATYFSGFLTFVKPHPRSHALGKLLIMQLINPHNPQSITIHPLVLLDFGGFIQYCTCVAQRIEHVAMCTKSINLHRLPHQSMGRPGPNFIELLSREFCSANIFA